MHPQTVEEEMSYQERNQIPSMGYQFDDPKHEPTHMVTSCMGQSFQDTCMRVSGQFHTCISEWLNFGW